MVDPSHIRKPSESFTLKSENNSTTTQFLEQSFTTVQPVTIVDDAIEVNEDQLQENQIYTIFYHGKRFYIQKDKGITEIFELAD